MDSLITGWLTSIMKSIESLQQTYKNNRGMLLTEGDLECHLFNELFRQPEMSGYHYCKNDLADFDINNTMLKTSFIHSQVTWFKPGKESGFEVDLTIGIPGLLEVKNMELFEMYTSKGFAYDGPCIAIEVKFIRDEYKASQLSTEDYFKFRDRLIPAKLKNIQDEKYKISNSENIAFVSVVGCKTAKCFEVANKYLSKHIYDPNKPCPSNLKVCVFYQDEIKWY